MMAKRQLQGGNQQSRQCKTWESVGHTFSEEMLRDQGKLYLQKNMILLYLEHKWQASKELCCPRSSKQKKQVSGQKYAIRSVDWFGRPRS